MKILTIFLLTLFSCSICAQKSIFIRVFDLNGKKMNKGRLDALTDSSLQLKQDSSILNIPVSTIGSIRTKRSGGNNMLKGAILGATTLSILGAATADPDLMYGYTAGEGAAAGAVLGAVAGAAVGGITILAKNSRLFQIDGDAIKWQEMRSALLTKPK